MSARREKPKGRVGSNGGAAPSGAKTPPRANAGGSKAAPARRPAPPKPVVGTGRGSVPGMAWWQGRMKGGRPFVGKPKQAAIAIPRPVESDSPECNPQPCQIDTGIFCGRQTMSNEPPRVWVWCAHGSSVPDFEYWMLMNPGHQDVAPYTPCTQVGTREYLRLEHGGLPLPPAAKDARNAVHRDLLHAAIVAWYASPSRYGLTVSAGDFRKFLLVRATEVAVAGLTDPGAQGVERALGPGVFAVYQLANPVEPMLPLAWVWVSDQPGAEQLWMLMQPNPSNPDAPSWRRPGLGLIDAHVWFECVPGAPSPADAPSFDAWIRQTWPHTSGALLAPEHLRAVDL